MARPPTMYRRGPTLVLTARKRKPQNSSAATDRNISFPGTAISFHTFREAVGCKGLTE